MADADLANSATPAAQLSQGDYAQRAGVDVSQIQGEAGNFTVGEPKPEGVGTPLPQEPAKPVSDTGQSTYEQGFNAAKAAGEGSYTRDEKGNVYDSSGQLMTLTQGKPNSLPLGPDGKPITNLETLPLNSSQGRDIVNKYVGNNTSSSGSDLTMAANQAHQQYLNDYGQYLKSSTQNENLTQEYTRLSEQMGLPALNTQLLNMKTVMNGTEDDLRAEITKAGGFATNSQVLALTSARNKVLIKNYNSLLQTRDDMQKNLTTMMGLSEKDRAYSSQQIDKQLNFDTQQEKYADQMLKNAQDALNNMGKTYGWDVVLKSALASGDPTAVQRINTTMGNGFNLETMATAPASQGKITTLETTNGRTFKVTRQGNRVISQVEQKPTKGKTPADKTQKTIDSFNKDLANKSSLFGPNAVTREQFGRQLMAKYPNIKPDAIMREIYATYPDNFNK